MNKPITGGEEWTFEKIEDMYEHVSRIANDTFHLNAYPNQLEIISSEQMLDAYAAIGMPIFYPHWSFGKEFVNQSNMYKRGYMGLAYEIVINSSPCIAYLMEENTMLMQTLVTAHASFGHNHFFKNNYLFKQWTDAESIIDYLVFAKKYIRDCEELHGVPAVEEVLDACHAIQQYGVDKYKRPVAMTRAETEERRKSRDEYIQSQLNEIWITVPQHDKDKKKQNDRFPSEPQENLMYFIEKNAPNLDEWKRELLRIVRKISQYFYPQGQTQLMNEGCATYFHYQIIHEMYDQGLIDDGGMLEFYESHTGVVLQPDYNDKRYSGINVYALGFAMYKDIERIATDPTDEDKEWFATQDWVGCGDPIGTIHWAIENFKDESFIQQFLSPKIIRDFHLFSIMDDEDDPEYVVSAIHNERGYKHVRQALANQYSYGKRVPDIQVYDIDRWGDRSMTLRHYMVDKKPLDPEDTAEVLKHIALLWGYEVKLQSVDDDQNIRAEFDIKDNESLLDIFLDDE